MEFVRPTDYDEALQKLGARSPVGSVLKSADWRDRIPAQLRERAFFSATVEDVRFLQRGQNELLDFLSGARETNERGESYLKSGTRAQFIERLQKFAIKEGMGPLDKSKAGTVEDVTSETRLGLIFDINRKSAQDFGYWKQGMDPAVLDAFPAQRFIRVHQVKHPRPWHQAALGQVRLKTDLHYWISLNRDFGVPWGPWGYNSGCDVEDVSRREAEAMGLLTSGEAVRPVDREFNEQLEASAAGLSPQFRQALKTIFGDQVVIEGDRARWISPGEAPQPAPPPKPRPAPVPPVPKPVPPVPVPRPPVAPVPNPPIPPPAKPVPPPPPIPRPAATPPASPAPRPAPQVAGGPTQPAGTQISLAAQIQMKGRDVTTTWATLRIIDAVHGDGKLLPIPFDYRVSGKSEGTYWSDYTSARSIGVAKGSSNPEMTLAHEVGHWLCHIGIPSPGKWASETSPLLQDWRTAVSASAAYQSLLSRPASSYRDYQLKWTELFARAYAQFIAQRSGNAAMLQDLDNVRQSRTNYWPESQWHPADFAPISAAIEKLFLRLGWMQPAQSTP